ncbi:hypothetical protein ABN763_08685 [Spongiivirga sp. MCCC 1A20706]|uniref:hypothetical protein n=1 Tax=Spongiivirga sp. MCCC 1A20706 TaxID=3160963 RepID=UPI003977CA26
MKMDQCTYDLGTEIVDGCDQCRTSRFKTHHTIRLGAFRLVITRNYQIKTCFEGFAPGNLINAFSLLPGEEQEVEIVRRSKYSKALHEERSVESEFESELQNTMRVELNSSQDFNFTQSAGGGFNFFGLFGGGAEVTAEQDFSFDQSFFNEVIAKTSLSVSRKYDVAIDIKTEVENRFRSLRKIKNPNDCKVVTYFFKQLHKKYSFEVSLLSVKFDIVRVLPPIFGNRSPFILKQLAVSDNQEILPVKTLELADVGSRNLAASNIASSATFATAAVSAARPSKNVSVSRSFEQLNPREERQFLELDDALLNNRFAVLNVPTKSKNAILRRIKAIKDSKFNKPRVVHKTEYCVRTHNVIAEPKVSECSICDCGCADHKDPDLRKLEIEKLQVEIDLLKKQLND